MDGDFRINANVDELAFPSRMRKECILFYCPETEGLAKKVAAQSDSIVLGKIKWK